MDTLFLYNTKTLKEKFKTKVFAGDNHITKINVQIPDNIGGYPKSECEYNLRAIIPEGNLSYMINPSQPYFYITNDITEKAQTVKLMMIITHEGNVIGRTNTVDLVVNEPAEAPDPPLTPRAEFDEVIAEQRAEIAEQAETISTQGETITQQTEQITELNDEVSTLEGTVAEQQATITRQNTTIDELNERRIPVYIEPQLVPKEVTPQLTNQYIEPPEGKNGFNAISVNPITSNLVPNCEPQNIAKGKTILGVTGTFDSFPENPVGGIYFYEPDENDNPTALKIYKYISSTPPFSLINNPYPYIRFVDLENSGFSSLSSNFFSASDVETIKLPNTLPQIQHSCCYNCGNLKQVEIPNSVIGILSSAFARCYALTKVTLPSQLATLGNEVFYICTNLTTINMPTSLTSIGTNVFYQCSALKNVTIENGFNCNSLNLSVSTRYSAETIVSWLEALADRTGQTAYTLTMGTANLNKLTNEQKAIATNKNWNLA